MSEIIFVRDSFKSYLITSH